MRSRGALVHLVLLLCSLGFAYQTWTRPKDDGKSKIAADLIDVWDARPDQVTAVVLLGEKKFTKIERKQDGPTKYFWVTTEREKPSPAKKSDDEAESALSEPAAPATTRKTFAAGEAADKLFQSFAPLRALRALGKPTGSQPKDYGLDAPKDTLQITINGQTRELKLGAKVYGGADRYALDVRSGEAFVLSGDLIRDLESAESRLMERELHAFKTDEVGGLVISRGNQRRELVKSKVGGDAKTAAWADAAKPDTKDDAASNWVSKVERLKVQEYVEDESKLGGAEGGVPDLVLRVQIIAKQGRRELGFLELLRLPSEKAGKFDYYARTEHTKRLVKLSQYLGEQVEQDLDAVLSK